MQNDDSLFSTHRIENPHGCFALPLNKWGVLQVPLYISPSVRRFLFLVCRHVKLNVGLETCCEGEFTTPNHVHGG